MVRPRHGDSLSSGLKLVVFAGMMLFPFLVFFISFALGAEPVKIVVLDTGLDSSAIKDIPICPNESYDFINDMPGVGRDTRKHGTEIAYIIKEMLDKKIDYCLIIYKVFAGQESTYSKVDAGLKRMQTLKFDYLNASYVGTLSITEEHDELKKIIDKGVKVFVPLGNESTDLDWKCIAYPACYRDLNLFRIGSLDSYSNYGKFAYVYDLGDSRDKKTYGTSFATPRALSRYILNHNRSVVEKNEKGHIEKLYDIWSNFYLEKK